MPYTLGVVVVGVILLILTIFGAQLVAKASTAMSVIILICIFAIFVMGISGAWNEIKEIISIRWVGTNPDGSNISMISPIIKVLTYAGFQCVAVPAMVSCGASL